MKLPLIKKIIRNYHEVICKSGQNPIITLPISLTACPKLYHKPRNKKPQITYKIQNIKQKNNILLKTTTCCSVRMAAINSTSNSSFLNEIFVTSFGLLRSPANPQMSQMMLLTVVSNLFHTATTFSEMK